jgi:hypothetical protein
MMKIILTITDSRGRNIVFVPSEGKPFQSKAAIALAIRGVIEGVYPVQKRTGTYLRTKPSIPKEKELETISLSGRALAAYAQGIRRAQSAESLSNYIKFYAASLVGGHAYILPVGQPMALRALTEAIKEKLMAHRKYILEAAKEFSIDPAMLGAILIDEIARLLPFESIFETLGGDIIGANVSVGVAQVKIDTAHDLIRKGAYHPNLKDRRLPYVRLINGGRRHLYDYLIQPKHNVRFAAAFIRFVIDFWSQHIDLSNRTDIVATLYNQGYGEPKKNPKANERGKQIANEFYPLAKSWSI